MARFHIHDAKKLLGLSPDFRLRSEEDFATAMAICKDKIVDARKANDDSLAAEFSRCKELFRARHNRLLNRRCECGNAKHAHAMRCSECARTHRFYSRNLMLETIKQHEIEATPSVIPTRRHMPGVLTGIIQKLAETGQLGDSFVTNRGPTSVKNQAKLFGLKTIIRIANIQERDMKKRLYRIWRSDGKSEEEMNEIIRKRLAGEPVPPTPPCVPPPFEELQKLKGRKHPLEPGQARGRPGPKAKNRQAAEPGGSKTESTNNISTSA